MLLPGFVPLYNLCVSLFFNDAVAVVAVVVDDECSRRLINVTVVNFESTAWIVVIDKAVSYDLLQSFPADVSFSISCRFLFLLLCNLSPSLPLSISVSLVDWFMHFFPIFPFLTSEGSKFGDRAMIRRSF